MGMGDFGRGTTASCPFANKAITTKALAKSRRVNRSGPQTDATQCRPYLEIHGSRGARAQAI